MNKRGSHVGIILSFAIFILFVTFILIVLNPSFNTGERKDFLMDYLKTEIVSNVTSDLERVSVRFNEGSSSCLLITDFSNKVVSRNGIVKKGSEIINGKFSEDDFFLDSTSEGVYELYLSDKFVTEDVNVKPNCNSESEIINIRNEKIVFISEIKSLIGSYESDYNSVKNDFRIPSNSEFEISFVLNDGSIIHQFEKQTDQTVLAEEVLLRYIDEEANINTGFLKIRLW